jgi:hypothetical protein
MASTQSPTQSDFSSDLWPEESSGAKLRPVDLDANDGPSARKRPSFRRRALRTLITFGLGIGATLGWQSYGDTAREMIANASPQLAWLAPQAASAEQAAAETVASAAPASSAMPAASAPDPQQLNATSLGLAAVRQSVDQLAAQLATSQQQMANELAKLQVAEQDILFKISAAPQVAAPPPRPAAAPAARKPVALMPPPPSAATPR